MKAKREAIEQQKRQKEEDEMAECTFKPKINNNVKVPTDRMFAKPSYSRKFSQMKAAAAVASQKKSAASPVLKPQSPPRVGVFKNYSTAHMQKNAVKQR